MKNFWREIKKPIFCLAPMADVTDCAFRQIIAKYSFGPNTRPTERSFGRVFFTEFVSADGLAHPDAREKLLIDLKYGENERPIVAQIFGGKPENIKIASALCKDLGFDGIDINMGCPDKTIEKQCAGAAMMKDYKLAREIICAAKEGAGGLPISVKTRIGYNKIDLEWVRELLKEDLAALILHLRTRKEMSNVPAHWEVMKRIMEIRDEIYSATGGVGEKTLILGNGDVVNIDDARRKCEEFGCDGVMLGRAIFGNPWLFANLACVKHNCQVEHPVSNLPNNTEKKLEKDKNKISLATQSRNSAEHSECVACIQSSKFGTGVSIEERLRVMLEHTKLFEKMLGGQKNFAIMKKHYKAYVNGFDARPTERSFGRGAKELRMKLMEAKNTQEVEKIVNGFLNIGPFLF